MVCKKKQCDLLSMVYIYVLSWAIDLDLIFNCK